MEMDSAPPRSGGTQVVNESEQNTPEIARLEGRVAELERLLAARSQLLRELSQELCNDDVLSLSRLASGLAPLTRAAFGLHEWRETTSLTLGDVEKTMDQLWRSVSRRTGNGE